MLDLWKPIRSNDERLNPIVFNELGQIHGGNKSFRPFIIFYDSNEGCYYYLKTQDKYFKDGRVKDLRLGEIEIKQSVSKEGLFTKDSYIDCSQIFKCDKDLLESLVDKEDKFYKSTLILPKNDIIRIKEQILKNILIIPPYLSIVEVKLNHNNFTYGENLYLCEKKYNEVLEKIHKDIYDDDNIHDITDLKSGKNDEYSFQRNRYQNGINFCLLFLNEYFPDQIEKFKNVQEKEPKKGKQKC